MMGIDVLPCLSINKRKLIWSQTDNWAIALMQLLGFLSRITLEESEHVGYT